MSFEKAITGTSEVHDSVAVAVMMCRRKLLRADSRRDGALAPVSHGVGWAEIKAEPRQNTGPCFESRETNADVWIIGERRCNATGHWLHVSGRGCDIATSNRHEHVSVDRGAPTTANTVEDPIISEADTYNKSHLMP